MTGDQLDCQSGFVKNQDRPNTLKVRLLPSSGSETGTTDFDSLNF